MEETQIEDIAKNYFSEDEIGRNGCYLAITEAIGKEAYIPRYHNIEIPPDKNAPEIFKKALEKINEGFEGAHKIEVHEWSGWCVGCHSLRIKVCPISNARLFELGKVFSQMWEKEKLRYIPET